jgi:hypothetical protein
MWVSACYYSSEWAASGNHRRIWIILFQKFTAILWVLPHQARPRDFLCLEVGMMLGSVRQAEDPGHLRAASRFNVENPWFYQAIPFPVEEYICREVKKLCPFLLISHRKSTRGGSTILCLCTHTWILLQNIQFFGCSQINNTIRPCARCSFQKKKVQTSD